MNHFLHKGTGVRSWPRGIGALIGLLAALLLIAAPVQAVTYGELDGARHPNAGGLVAAKQDPDGTWLYCSGTLISPTVFLTAAHCDEGTARVTVTFDPDYRAGDPTYTGTWYAEPLFGQQQNDPHDLAFGYLRSGGKRQHELVAATTIPPLDATADSVVLLP